MTTQLLYPALHMCGYIHVVNATKKKLKNNTIKLMTRQAWLIVVIYSGVLNLLYHDCHVLLSFTTFDVLLLWCHAINVAKILNY